jgi:hypothetical protein
MKLFSFHEEFSEMLQKHRVVPLAPNERRIVATRLDATASPLAAKNKST